MFSFTSSSHANNQKGQQLIDLVLVELVLSFIPGEIEPSTNFPVLK